MTRFLHFRWWLLAVMAFGVAASAAQASGKRFAVLVGIRNYAHPKLRALRYTENDVTELAKLLRSHGYEVVLLTGATGKKEDRLRPTRANIDREVRRVLRACRKGDLVLVGLAGHGLQFEGQKDGFFCPADARPFPDETGTLVSLGALYREMDRSFAGSKILLVDACRDDPLEGAATRGIEAGVGLRPPAGVAALFSCSAGERAFESDKLRHGVFFHFVLEGLKGQARDLDGDVTFDALSGYVRKRVSREVPAIIGGGARQSPNRLASGIGESPILARISRALLSLEKGTAHLARHEYEPALRELTRALTLDPKDARAPAFRGWARILYFKDPRSALADCDRALALDPRLALAYAVRGWTHALLGDKGKALADCDRALALDPALVLGYAHRAEILAETGAFARARADCARALRLDPRSAQVYKSRGYVAKREGKLEEAVADFGKAVALDPTDNWTWYHRGLTHRLLDKHERAVEDLSRALAIEPTDGHSLKSRGQSHEQLGNHALAQADYTRAIALNGEDNWAYYYRALLYHQQAQFRKAVADLTQAIRIDPKDAYSHHHRARAYHGLEEYARAVADFTKAIELQPDSASSYYGRALAYAALGKRALAEADRRRFQERTKK